MRKIISIILAPLLFTSCTVSLQNIDTHGTATDVVDENLSTKPTISPTLTIPVKPL